LHWRTDAHHRMEADEALPASAGACRRGPRNPRQRRTLARADPRGPVTVSDRPEDRPVPNPARASARNARTRTAGRTDGTSTHPGIPDRETIREPARKTHGARESKLGFRSGSKIRQRSRCWPRSCASHRAKAPAVKGIRRHKPQMEERKGRSSAALPWSMRCQARLRCDWVSSSKKLKPEEADLVRKNHHRARIPDS
jgi:hypothetical protein